MVLVHGNKARGLARLRDAGFHGLPFVSLDAKDILAGDAIDVPSIASQLGHATLYAVRSSSATEDTETHAAAGAFLTLLGISASGLPDACLQVAKSLPQTTDEHGVVIQPFLAQPEASGVLFTHKDRYHLNLAPGLCAYVVQGQAVEEIGCHPSGKIYRRVAPEIGRAHV